MPFDTGNLQNDSTFIDDSQKENRAELVLYQVHLMQDDYIFIQSMILGTTNNSNAGGKWFEPYISGNKSNFAKEAFAKLFKRNGGL